MPRVRYISKATALFKKTLSPERQNELGRETRFIQRERIVTAASVVWAFVVALGAQPTQYISDVLRTMNRREGWNLRYKPFWDRLAKPAFPRFMKALFQTMCQELVVQVLRRERASETAFFSDILIDDGSSFAVADGLRKVFPGRFTKVKPAAVELHAHMSVMSDSIVSVALAPDKETERAFLPAADSLPARSLSLRDRGYIDLDYFEALEDRNAYLICRANREINPTVQDVIGVSRALAKRWRGKKLQQLPKSKLKGLSATFSG